MSGKSGWPSGIPSDSRESASVADGGLSEASPCDQAPAGASRLPAGSPTSGAHPINASRNCASFDGARGIRGRGAPHLTVMATPSSPDLRRGAPRSVELRCEAFVFFPTVPVVVFKDGAHTLTCEMLAAKAAACLRQRQIWDSVLASLSGQSREDWNETLQKLSAHGPQGVLGFGEDFDADVAVAMRLADFVLEGPAAIGLKRTDPEAVPQRMYTSDYDSASGAEEHEEAAAATASPTTHST